MHPGNTTIGAKLKWEGKKTDIQAVTLKGHEGYKNIIKYEGLK